MPTKKSTERALQGQPPEPDVTVFPHKCSAEVSPTLVYTTEVRIDGWTHRVWTCLDCSAQMDQWIAPSTETPLPGEANDGNNI